MFSLKEDVMATLEDLMPKFEDLMEKLFLNNGCDIWPVAHVYAATFVSTSLRRRSVLPPETAGSCP